MRPDVERPAPSGIEPPSRRNGPFDRSEHHSRRNDLMATKAKTKKVKDLSAKGKAGSVKGGRINRA
jgi:hypothetical protein